MRSKHSCRTLHLSTPLSHLIHTEPISLGVARIPVLDQVKGLQRAKGREQLSDLLLREVVWEAAHKDAIRTVRSTSIATENSYQWKHKEGKRGDGVNECGYL